MDTFFSSIQFKSVHFLLAFILFFLLNWIGKHSYRFGYISLSLFYKRDEAPAFNFVLKALSPVFFIIIVSTIFYALQLDYLTKGIWLIAVYHFAIRYFFILFMVRARLINWTVQFLYFFSTTLISYFAYEKLIKTKANLLPSFESISNQLWIIIALFIYTVLNNISIGNAESKKRKENYLLHMFSTMKNKFSEVVENETEDKQFEAFIYSVMIFENFNRPRPIRLIEYIVFPLFSKTLGIMQVETEKRISDIESIKIAIEKLKKDKEEILANNQLQSLSTPYSSYNQRTIYGKLAKRYNPCDDYESEVLQLFNEIQKKFYPEIKSALGSC